MRAYREVVIVDSEDELWWPGSPLALESSCEFQ